MDNSSHLLFPIEEMEDYKLLSKFAFETVREVIYERLEKLLVKEPQVEGCEFS
jgi:hypothetical protein